MTLTNRKQNTIVILLMIYGLEGLAANLAHAITPNLIEALKMPSYMFGVAFAAMAFTNFAFSPFWGNLCNYIDARKMLLICCVGYAIGQGIFGIATSEIVLTIGRLVSGLFVSGISVATTFYVIQHSSEEERARNITMTITTFTVCGTFGFFIGGYLGTIDIYLTFILQCILLTLSGLLFFFLLEKTPANHQVSFTKLVKDSNPIKAFFEIKPHLNKTIVLLFVTVLLASFASTSLTQNYAYYVQNYLRMSSLVNGIAKGLVGIFAIVANFTITFWILKQRGVEKKLSYLFALMIGLYALLVLVAKLPIGFLSVGVVLMVLDTMQVSILQDRNAAYATCENQGVMLGMHNAMKSLGMIGGSMISSMLYDIERLSPFYLCIILVFGAFISTRFIIKEKRISHE